MIIDMRPILSGEKTLLEFSYTERLEADLLPDVAFQSAFEVNGIVRNMAGYITLTLTAELPYEGQCARCLSPVNGIFKAVVERPVAQDGTLENTDDDDDDYLIIEDGMLDIDSVLQNQIYLDFPTRLLCAEDCRGLCPKCGRNLNEGECGCVRKEIDPRLAPLMKLLNTDENDK